MTRRRGRRARATPAPLELFGRASTYVRQLYLTPAAEADFIRHQEDLMPSSDPPLAAITPKWLGEQDDEDVRDLYERLTTAAAEVENELHQRAEQLNAESQRSTGAKVAQLRNQRGLTVAELAERAGVGPGPINALEKGAGNPRLETLLKIATGLGVPIAELLDS